MPYEAKTDWKYDDTVTEKDLNRIEQGLKDAHVAEREALTLSPGVQVVEVENETPFNFGSVRGRTLVNLLGRNGRCDKIGFFGTGGAGNVIVDSTIKRYGDATFKITQTAGETSFVINGAFAVDRTKKYMFAVDVLLTHSSAGGRVVMNLQQSGAGAVIGSGTANAELLGTWQTIHATFDASKLNSPEMSIVVGTMGDGAVTCNVDGVRCYEITQAEYDVSVSLTPEQVATRYPYVDGMTNVHNPYVGITGANLLPPFTEWSFNITILDARPSLDPYAITYTATKTHTLLFSEIDVLPNTTYYLSCETQNGEFGIHDVTGTKVISPYSNKSRTFNTGEYNRVRVYLSNREKLGDFTFRNPMLVVDTEAKPFAPQQRSIWAAECQLAAHPVDGSNPDTLFVGDDGLPYTLGKWGKMVVSGDWNWKYNVSWSTHKRVYVANLVPVNSVGIQQYMTKYDGNPVYMDGAGNGPDQFQIQPATGYLYVTIPNADSGWGPDYTPDADEIKAYFMGWRMCQQETAGLYNGTGTRCWGKITDPVNVIANPGWSTVTVLPTELAGTDGVGNVYTPYRLQYLKAKPTVEPVANYETGATLCKGANMVEVGSGIVLREKANPSYYSENDSWFINNGVVTWESTRFQHKANKIINIYEGATKDSRWTVENISLAYGNERAYLSNSYYDPTAVYHVTYTMLEPTLAAPISGSIAANLRATVSDLVQHTGDMERRLAVVESQKAEKDAPQWIKPTLLNGLTELASTQYVKDSLGFVHIRGRVKSLETIPNETVLFKLPVGYRPEIMSEQCVATFGGTKEICNVQINIDGSVKVWNSTGTVIYLDRVSFQAK
ncbi:hypothetical protein LQV63_18830 [Paenibacillus profundus]|uniref:Uncharacterized protein n=1 Tax=Paenibacillus profundus TaxID=1173085 RepID=A0ABS8YJG8_9BACL|nr:hypothetical protein [Paenibacillus profundus]MCE5171359.1 hypothetical protein [Paenibacillus profundus]